MTDPQERAAGLLRHPWIRLLVAAWIIAILAIYFRLQFGRVLAIAPAATGAPTSSSR